jgi:hypothetical protein
VAISQPFRDFLDLKVGKAHVKIRRSPYLILAPLVPGALLGCAVALWDAILLVGMIISSGQRGGVAELFAFTLVPNLGVSATAVLLIRLSWRMAKSSENRPLAATMFMIGVCSALAVTCVIGSRLDSRLGAPLFIAGALGATAMLLLTPRLINRESTLHERMS